ncbi:DNA gyrase subunit A [Geomicrobium sp. JCM 19038]|uniref:DNA gyrase subunit A n=1 Tax=Geomicrobium sp. JCM 19038 TaxID=1460635 RepID=UPI00045F4BAE|nr:DNA gyrase subunit A [Geomicrobium sp. JCM 19038]GAK06903.1 DNA gyrase subunit A [Geomicrobium sp. JCM 19038]
MADQESRIHEINISQEMQTSFLDYAMSVIVSRALPDVRDGMKPVHRRILYAMNELGMTPDKAYKKSARIVGDVIGKYHPHGDSAVYEAMVRMAQDFSYRYMLVDGHGNFGSVDGDSAAAMRYTEAKMSKISTELVRDIRKDTIDYQDNYDGAEREPVVLPARFPNLLVNGASGIAVGMATNIPPHQLGEVIDGLLAYSKDEEITIEELMEYIPGPDFPTAGLIMGRSGIRKAYQTGRGSITLRANVHIDTKPSGKEEIIVTELPYQVNKARLVEKIAELVREKKIEGITDLRDESARQGMRIVIEVRKDTNSNVLLNNLYKLTSLQTTFGINMLALVGGQPKVLNLKETLKHYLDHQIEVIRRRTQFDLNKAEARAHILEGLRIALDHIDDIIALIRGSETTEIARNGLMESYELSYEQAQAILDMRLQRLTGLERDKIEQEYNELIAKIAELKAILADDEKVLTLIREELAEVRERYNDERRTAIHASENVLEDEDLIPQENIVITVTHEGYIKRLPITTYKSQRRGGRGIQGMGTNDGDFVEHLFTTNSHQTILFFTNKGKVYRLKGYEIPELSRTAKGIPIINLLQIEKGEEISTVIPIDEFSDDNYLFFLTKKGIAKRTPLSAYANIRKGGLFAINLRDDDELHGVRLTNGDDHVIIGTKNAMAIRFEEEDVRSMGRTAGGVKAINLDENDQVVGMDIVGTGQKVLIVSNNGYGKRTNEDEFRIQNRGGKGLRASTLTERTGHLVALRVISDDYDLMLITAKGVLIRIKADEISTLGRYAQGVTLIRVADDEEVSSVAPFEPDEEAEEIEEMIEETSNETLEEVTNESPEEGESTSSDVDSNDSNDQNES